MSDQTSSYLVAQGSQDKQRINVGAGGAEWHSQQPLQHQAQMNFNLGQRHHHQQHGQRFPNSDAQAHQGRPGESIMTDPLPGTSGFPRVVMQSSGSLGESSQGSNVSATTMQPTQSSKQTPATPAVVVVQGKSRTTCNFCMLRKKRCDYEEINGQKQPCR